MTNYSRDYSRRSRRVKSRLARHEEKKVMKQTLIFSFLSILIGIIFIFFVMPASVNFFFNLIGSGPAFEEQAIPPQVPVLRAPQEDTSESKLNVSGFGESGSTIVLIVNGNEVARTDVAEDGSFNFEIQLSEGENMISTYAIGDNDQESDLSREYKVVLDTEAPTLELETPQDGQQIELRQNQLTTIKGVTEPRAKVYINGRLVSANSEGKFSTSFQLQEGDNLIKFKVEDKAGNQFEHEITVKFRF